MRKKSNIKYAISAFIGLGGGIFCVVQAIVEAGRPDLFWNAPSFFIIIGGTTAAMILGFQLNDLKTLPSVIKQAFIQDKSDMSEDINTLVQLDIMARKSGLLALEKYGEESSDHFLKKGIALLVDGTHRDDLEALMLGEIQQSQKRHRIGISMVSKIASLAPALGLVGTYVGLIPMLCSITDPEGLGPLMAVELVSSFYGGFLANIIFSPIASRLQNKNSAERRRQELLLEGILGIYDSKSPRQLQELLMRYLTKKKAGLASKMWPGSATQTIPAEPVAEANKKGA